jgi:hypothetical protein
MTFKKRDDLNFTTKFLEFHWGAFTKYVRFWGGVQRFVTNLCKNIGICTVLRYEGGGGSKIPEYSVTYFVNGPLLILVPKLKFAEN